MQKYRLLSHRTNPAAPALPPSPHQELNPTQTTTPHSPHRTSMRSCRGRLLSCSASSSISGARGPAARGGSACGRSGLRSRLLCFLSCSCDGTEGMFGVCK